MCGNKTPGNLFAVGVMALVAVLSAVCIPRGINAALRRRSGASPKASVCERLSSRFPMKPRFVELNGGVARAVGRRCCNKRLRYRNGMIGHAYGVSGRCITNGCREVSVELSFASRLRERGVPFLFVLAPCKMSFDGGLMPCGWRCDNQNAESRAVARMLADSGVEVLDLVPRYPAPLHFVVEGACPERRLRRLPRKAHRKPVFGDGGLRVLSSAFRDGAGELRARGEEAAKGQLRGRGVRRQIPSPRAARMALAGVRRPCAWA